MCGFSGLLTANRNHSLASEWKEKFAEAAQRIAHRGNDEARLVQFADVSLHHFRLAFQDIESGRQPMLSADGRLAITFNGEIYNHFELRKILEKKHGKREWRTLSDTETIVEGWALEGNAFADQLEGEFAFVIVRTDGSECFAARDTFGVKPLFIALADCNTRMFSCARPIYQLQSPVIAFASEMKALPCKKNWNRDGALRQFVGLFEPICTPYENIIQCPPGGRLHGQRLRSPDSEGVFNIYVSTRTQPIRRINKSAFWSEPTLTEKLKEFRNALSHSVEERLLSDVELGVYQSGGIDSKAVAFELAAALQRRESPWLKEKLKSFTVGFAALGYDESEEAIAFSRHLGFQPHLLRLSSSALSYSYPHAVNISENIQPFTNGAAKWWLSLFARQYVPGVLTGDGADELLCGYPSFRYCAWWAFSQRGRKTDVPLGGRWRDDLYIKKFAEQSRDPWLAGSSAEGSGEDFELSLALWGVPHPLFGQIFTITESILGREEAQLWLSSQGPSLRSWFQLGLDNVWNVDDSFLKNPENALVVWQNYFCHTHLPVQILNWVGDRMEMANTLEGRTPFLSGALRNLVANLPDIALIQGFLDKSILRKAYVSQFPRQFALTPKKQFNAPFINLSQLFHEYDAENLLQKMGLTNNSARVASALLKNSNQNTNELSSASERYAHTHKLSSLQTLICAAIVQRSLVEENSAKRDTHFEQEIIAQGGPVS